MLFLTRKQYDFLVIHRQNWMLANWGVFSKTWSLGGVCITGAPHMVENLQHQLEG